MKRLPRLLVLLGAAFVLGACAGDLPTGGGRAAVPHGPARTFDLNPACETTGQVHTGGADSAITTTQHWYPEGNPHLVHGVILVENGAQLRIHAGTVVCFNGGGIEARNGGQLAVDGDDTARVVLTPLYTDFGWTGVWLYDTPAASSFIKNAVLEHVTYSFAVYAADRHKVVLDSVHVRQAAYGVTLFSPGSRILRSRVDTTTYTAVQLGDSTRFTQTVVRGSGNIGVEVVGTSGVELLGGRIEGSAGPGLVVAGSDAVMSANPIRITGGAMHPAELSIGALAKLYHTLARQDSLLGNARDTLHVTAGTATSAVYAGAAVPWWVSGVLTFGAGSSLRAQSGAALIFEWTGTVRVRDGGRLLARGSAGAPARFTAQVPAYGWHGIHLDGAPTGSSFLTNAVVEHTDTYATAVFAEGSHPLIIDSTVVRHVAQAVVLASHGSRLSRSRVDTVPGGPGRAAVELSSNARLESTLVRGAGDMGVLILDAAVQVLSCEVRESGGVGMVTWAAAPVHNCNLVDNGAEGLSNNSATSVNADNNWWGDAAGPTGTSGDGVAGIVDHTPWRTTPYALPFVP